MKIYICEEHGAIYWLEKGLFSDRKVLIGMPLSNKSDIYDLDDGSEIDLNVEYSTTKKHKEIIKLLKK